VRNVFIFLDAVSDFRFRNEKPATSASSAVVANELLYDRFVEKGTRQLYGSVTNFTIFRYF